MKTKTAKRKVMALVSAAVAVVMTGSVTTTVFASADTFEKKYLGNNGQYVTDYQTHEEALEAAKDVNLAIEEEGIVMLKNDGQLPLTGNEFVSVFGRAENALTGGQGSVHKSLQDAGFRVNPVLVDFYESNGADAAGGQFSSGGSYIGNEYTGNHFSLKVKNSMQSYGDVGVVVFSRTGGEGSDPVRVTNENLSDETENVYGDAAGWEHEGALTGKKHYLQLTKSEIELLDYVKENCKKVVVVLNTSNVMEMYNLEHDERINAIFDIGRPGANGIGALGKVLAGMVNPSGKTSDEWYRDFSMDPTWYNFGSNNQTNTSLTDADKENDWNADTYYYDNGKTSNSLKSVAYEEGIYLGYKYYETVYAEIAAGNLQYVNGELSKGAGTQAQADQWHSDNVVYPFGHGLSYSDNNKSDASDSGFEMQIKGVYTDAALKNELGNTVSETKLSSSVGKPAEIQKLYIPVKVTNESYYAGKQVVQLYVTAPYTAGGIEKAHVKLVGFAKTGIINPMMSETVVVSVDVQDMASFDYNDANKNGTKTYELDLGKYELKAMRDSHNAESVYNFEITGNAAAVLGIDDFSGNPVAATEMSNPDSEYYSIQSSTAKYGTNTAGAFFTTDMTIMSRTDLSKTPDVKVKNDLTCKAEFYNYLVSHSNWDADDQAAYPDANQRWTLTEAEFNEVAGNWTQGTGVVGENGMYPTIIRDMAGKPLFIDGKINPEWDAFMNQLTWKELVVLIEECSQNTPGIATIGKLYARNIDGPNSTANYSWNDESVMGNTWNVDMAYRQGVMAGNLYKLYGYVGWYAPAMNTHRSPFGGRNNEYYSQDGIHASYIALAATDGAESRGVNCYIKHFFLNDQETNRTNTCTWVDEQTMRENYIVPFQKSMQEGGASSLMMCFNRIGCVAGPVHYVALQDIVREEWGWEGIIGTDFYNAPGGYTTSKVNHPTEETTINLGACQLDQMIRNGGVHPLGNGTTLSGVWDSSLRGGKGGVRLGCKIGENYVTVNTTQSNKNFNCENGLYDSATMTEGAASLEQYYYVRLQAMRICYQDANSCSIDNGVLFGQNFAKVYPNGESNKNTEKNGLRQPAMSKDLGAISLAVAYEQNCAATDFELWNEPAQGKKGEEGYKPAVIRNVATYSIAEGALPKGLELNASTGVISGTPAESGDFKFVLQCDAGGQTGQVTMTLKVDNCFFVDGSTTVKAGEAVNLVIDYKDNTFNPADYNAGVEYSAKGLPEGLAIDKSTGVISGTTNEAGTYDVTVTVTGSIETKTTNSKGQTTTKITKTNYNLDFELVVEGEAAVDELAALNSAIDELEKKIGALENKEVDLSGVNASINELKTKVEALESGDDTTEINASINELKTKVEALEKANAEGGCGSSIGVGGWVTIASAFVVVGAVAMIIRKRKSSEE